MTREKRERADVGEIPSPCSSRRRPGSGEWLGGRASECVSLLGGRYEVERCKGGEEGMYIGQGAQSYGELGVDKKTGERVAVKRLKNHRKVEYPVADYFREVWILRELPVHECVVELRDVVSDREGVSLIFEACECDLRQYLKTQGPMEHMEYRMASLHLWAGLDHLHSRGICHRDLKCDNILIKEGYLKIGDFGLAKFVPEHMALGGKCVMTKEVASLWYRAPEVCLWEVFMNKGVGVSGKEMDVWGMGCVLYEMAVGKPLFAVESEMGLLMKMFSTFGTPELTAEEEERLPKFCRKWPKYKADHALYGSRALYTTLRARPIDAEIVELVLGKCLKMDPKKRITTSETLKMDIYKL